MFKRNLHKQLIRNLCHQIKYDDMAFVQMVDGGHLDEIDIAPCDRILIVGFKSGTGKVELYLKNGGMISVGK